MRYAAVLIALLPVAPLSAQHMYGPGGSSIYPVDAAQFEVVASSRQKAIWCGAVKYARRALKAGWQVPLVVTRGPEPSPFEDGRRPGTRFTIDPGAAGVAATARGATLAPGSWQTVSLANRNCVRLDNPSDR
ncbi:hypothetical protein [Marinibacterium profundimaris]|uniref:hypothetical protein n=1 Tax=Marinibacterium profundimaris TaxID=1679460 RepID=UPI000B522504|nr:hypothetical protein [Marinibacterium profundimaris]